MQPQSYLELQIAWKISSFYCYWLKYQSARKIAKFPKISIKMKNVKTLNESQAAIWNSDQVLRECISWAARNGAVKKFFLAPQTYMLLDMLQEYMVIMLSELRFVNWVRFFKRNCIVKWVTFVASFCWLWLLLASTGKSDVNK